VTGESPINLFSRNRLDHCQINRTGTPSGFESATLRFWLYPVSDSTSDGDEQRVLLLDQLGNTITTLVKSQSNTQTWTSYEFDLGQYAGQTFYLYFGVYNNGSGNVTAMYVDDVSLQVCPAP